MNSLIISHAQALEDIHLLRALTDVRAEDGFYIDIGANDPDIDSVTKLFYDRGWRGINVDASPRQVAKLREQRPRDVNLEVAVSHVPGPVTFYDQNGGLGTTVASIAQHHAVQNKIEMTPRVVATTTIADICAAHAPDQIHFLKIDVEGAEESALKSMDFERFRPWLLCIECHYPMQPDIQVFATWEPIVITAGYTLAFTDGINRYYVAGEHLDRLAAFAFPAQYCISGALARQIQQLEARVKTYEHCMTAIRKIAETA